MAMIRSWLNGVPTQSIPVDDRGLLYGDGFFTTIAIQDSNPLLIEAHYGRLKHSANRLKIILDMSALEESLNAFLEHYMALLVKQPRYLLKIIVTRCSAGRGYYWGENKQANVLFQLFSYDNIEELRKKRKQGLRLAICETRLASNPLLAGLKHLSRIEQVMASGEFDRTQYDEGLMLDSHDNVIEGCMGNIFLIQEEKVFSPKLNACGVEGVMKAEMIKNLSSSPYSYHEVSLRLDDFFQADAIFLTNALLGICPVRSIQGSSWSSVTDIEQAMIQCMQRPNIYFS